MTTEVRQILEHALALPALDRAALVEELLSSLDRPDQRIDELWPPRRRDALLPTKPER